MGTDIHGVFQAKKSGKWEDIPSNYDKNRNYLLFAWLGNVRNGYGFAGVPTFTEIIPLSDCRGIPDDFVMEDESHPIKSVEIFSPDEKKYHEEDEPLEIWMGDHSHSWVSADEVINTECPKVLRTGIVTNDTLSYFVDEVKRLKDEHGEVRFVFGFDS